MRRKPPWNHNIHFHPVVLDAVPAGARRALDVGCGAGGLTRELAGRVPEVVGLDPDEPTLHRAAAETPPGVTWVLGDVLTHPFEPGSYDIVASVAALHHMDAEAGLRRMAELVRPGGVLAVVGIARVRLPFDLPWMTVGAVLTRLLVPWSGYAHPNAPLEWPPPDTYAEARAIAERVLPGVEYRRRVLWRYTLVWNKPSSG